MNPDGAPGTSTAPRITQTWYDYWGMLYRSIDPMGNETLTTYDGNHNRTRVEVYGQAEDVAPGAPNAGPEVLLSLVEMVYDARDRLVSERTALFDGPWTASTDPTEFAVTATQYNQNGSVRAVSSLPHAAGSQPGAGWGWIEYFYDGAGRLVRTLDPAGNETLYAYDADSNLISQTSIESTPSGDEIFKVAYEHDALGRQTKVIERAHLYSGGNGGSQTSYAYDSRGNLVQVLDPLENLTQHVYDGLGRRTRTLQHMTIGGSGGDGVIETAVEYDDLSRVRALMDDNQLDPGHESFASRTLYGYDRLGREVQRVMPDGTAHFTEYDAVGNPVHRQDARGVAVLDEFDLNSRVIARTIAAPSGIDGFGGATWESFAYDGLGRLIRADNDFTRIRRAYDSRSNLIEEFQNADAANGFPSGADRVVSYAYDVAGNEIALTYPDGRTIHKTYDALGRLTDILDEDANGDPTAPIASYDYAGPGRVAARTSGNGVVATYAYNGHQGYESSPVLAGDAGFGRVASVTHALGSTIIDRRLFSWDAAGNRTAHIDDRTAFTDRRHRTFAYDSANRLMTSTAVFPALTLDPEETVYTLDGVHNRLSVSAAPPPPFNPEGWGEAGATLGAYTSRGDNAKNNQYTLSPDRMFAYGLNGSMTLRASLRQGGL